MTKIICDRCGKNLDSENMDYIAVSIADYSKEDSSAFRHWDFCHECISHVENSMMLEMITYQCKTFGKSGEAK